MRILAAFLLSLSGLLGQVVPGRYVVELTTPALGSLARPAARSAAANTLRARIQTEQASLRLWVERGGGRVLATVSAVMNAAVVDIPESMAGALPAGPGTAHVYPVRMAYPLLDHALPLHSVPQAWAAVGGVDRAGAGIKIGILDTGITPDHAAFQDASLLVPAGYPLFSKAENKAVTNNKIIVARSYEQFYNSAAQTDTARDRVGHGTATATCAAGVPNDGPLARISGVAPKAWIGAYKITPLNSESASGDAILKALDDALADGMDVVNLSFGSPLVAPVDQDVVEIGIDRMTQSGVIMVVAAGNSGPDLATISDFGTIGSAISVGASDSDRTLNAGVMVAGSGPFLAIPSNAAVPDQPLSARLRDYQQMQPGGTLCDAQSAGSAAGLILLAVPGFCLYETQLSNAAAAGAVAVIFSTLTPQQSLGRIASGQATLPSVMIGFDDANTIRAALAPDKPVIARISFSGVPFSSDPIELFGFSSRGPTYSYAIKPDMAATGYIYAATQSLDPVGELYNKSGYMVASGTSFSAPLVAGAAAVLKAARPGLTVAQYRSLLINSANPMFMHNGAMEHVQRTGAGILNLMAALNDNVSALPTAVSFGVGPGALNDQQAIILTNVGKQADTFTVSAVRFDNAPALLFGDDPRGNGAALLMTVSLAPGQSKTVYGFWRFAGLAPGEYEGLISVNPVSATRPVFIPYWYGIPAAAPSALTVVSPLPSQFTAGASFSVFFRAIDAAGIATTDPNALGFRATVTAGGGSVSALMASTLYPNLVFAVVTMGPEPGQNLFRVTFGDLPARTFTVTGTKASQ